MSQTVSEERRVDERRHLLDRRSPVSRRVTHDQRAHQRRSVHLRVVRDRRRGVERRSSDRRRLPDRRALARRQRRRRRATPSPFTLQQAADIQTSFTAPGARPKCPVCNGTFNLGSPRHRGRDVIRQVQCASCRKTTIVTNSLKARVIVVAQREAVRQMVRAVLTDAGHEVLEAADASIGLWAYGENPADVVFIDVLVPGRMNAGEFVRQLRRDHGDARVVAISGRPSYGTADPLIVAKQLGATKTMRMPFSSEEVLRVLAEARS